MDDGAQPREAGAVERGERREQRFAAAPPYRPVWGDDVALYAAGIFDRHGLRLPPDAPARHADRQGKES